MEIWCDVAGYEGYYQVSSKGRVRSCARTISVKPSSKFPTGGLRTLKSVILKPQGSPYSHVTLWKHKTYKHKDVHVLVAETFHGERPLCLEACHKNGNKSDNRAVNLYWGSPIQNAFDKRNHGTHIEGEEQGSAKLSKSEVFKIRELGESKSQAELSRIFQVGQSQIHRILNRKAWKHLR